MRHHLLILIFTCCLGSMSFAQNTMREVKANDPAIEYVARTLVSPGGDVSFDWTGSHLRTRFTGSSISVRLSDSYCNYYDIYVDNKFVRTIRSTGVDTTIVLADNLMSRQWHTLLMYKRTEGFAGITTLHGFLIEPKAEMAAVTERPKRKILFIGDSLTCGVGTETDDSQAPYLARTSNSYHAFGSITARYFNADYHLIAHSGEGAAKNYDDNTPTSKFTMKDRVYNVFDTRADVKWDGSLWQPDVVVINLGTNDFAKSDTYPSDEQFMEAYGQIFKYVRNEYGDIPIFNMSKRLKKVNTMLAKVVEAQNDPNIYFIPTVDGLYNETTDMGSSSHPNYKGQQKMAMSIVPYISSRMNWQLEPKAIE